MSVQKDLNAKAQELQNREDALNLREDKLNQKVVENVYHEELAKSLREAREEKLMYRAMREEQIMQRNMFIKLCQEIRDTYDLDY